MDSWLHFIFSIKTDLGFAQKYFHCRESRTYFSYMAWLFEKMLSFQKWIQHPLMWPASLQGVMGKIVKERFM